MLRAVTGTPRDATLAHRLTGSDALGIVTRTQVPELPELAVRLLNAYAGDEYRQNFDFIDHLRPEKPGPMIGRLQGKLLGDLRTRNLDDIHLAAPETLDWLDLAGFRLTSLAADQELEQDPHITTYLASREDDQIDLGLLNRDRLAAVRESDGQPMNRWPIYRCLVYQTEIDDTLYVLSAGDWFRVDLKYRDAVEADVRALPRLTGLPEADRGTDEDTYNKKAAAALNGLCLDKQLVFDGGPDKMEICDILRRGGGLVHVKLRGSSSTLSHLFSQGLNSAERLLLDQSFRDEARAVAKRVDRSFPAVLPPRRPNPADHEVSFVVVTRSTRPTPLTLPFFSLVSLRAAARQLDAFGFPVSVAAVPEA
jgi:uncharacterized protein (TIGR04141 family)